MDMRRLVGENVRRIREKKGAEISGFSQQYLSGDEPDEHGPSGHWQNTSGKPYYYKDRVLLPTAPD
jgi:hypothetical protein